MTGKACFRTAAIAVSVFLASTVLAASPDVSQYPEVSGNDLRWHLEAAHGGAELRVVRPDGKVAARSVASGEREISFTFPEDDQPEGTYLWEISLAPRLTKAMRSEMRQARREGVELSIEEELKGQRIQGSFRVVQGQIYGASGNSSRDAGVVERAEDGGYFPQAAPLDGDLTVRNSLCVGFDCQDAENYGADTIRLKENNLRITFLDTSDPTSTFAAGDWQLRANEQPNGGADMFAIDWLGTGAASGSSPTSTPFRIDAGAPGDALRIASSGRIGLGTPSPTVELHIRDGDTPALRLEQDDSSGFGVQSWDIAGNETNFFVRDVTNSSQLPFRIRPGAPTSSVDISSSGDVGIGTTSPAARLHVVGDARIDGALFQLSSRSAKTDFESPQASVLLEKVEQLDLGFWRYKDRDQTARHFGPTAEDFHAAFGLGGNERHISISDMAGIALGATQALQEELRRRDATIADLTQRLERLEAALEAVPSP